jgi:chorismate dehydratase
MPPIRVGVVRYLNARPLVEGLDACRGLSLAAAVPARIGPMLEAGRLDIGLASLIDFARARTPLALIPAGMIGCEGPTLTVRVFSKVPPAEVRTLAADTDSHTSVALARLLFRRVYGSDPTPIDLDAREMVTPGSSERWPEALLLIGDKVVHASPPPVRYPFQIDLGQAWFEMTGLPFAYAVWMCRAEDAERPEIHEAAALLDRQRRRNQARADWVVSARARERDWPEDLARDYLGTRLRFEVGPREREGIAEFLRLAAAEGLAPQAEPRYLEPAAAGAC